MDDEADEPLPWQRTGTTVYRLKPTGKWRRGEAVLANEFTVQVSGEGSEGLAQHIMELLHANPHA